MDFIFKEYIFLYLFAYSVTFVMITAISHLISHIFKALKELYPAEQTGALPTALASLFHVFQLQGFLFLFVNPILLCFRRFTADTINIYDVVLAVALLIPVCFSGHIGSKSECACGV